VTLQAGFYPGEVARLLKLSGVDYSQLRELYVLARKLRGEPEPTRTWARFSLADLAAVEVLVSLGGGRKALSKDRRLILGRIEETCNALRRMGFDDPLLQVPLVREGRQILAKVEQYIFEPASGQLVIEDTGVRIDRFLEQRIIEDQEVRAAIHDERNRVRPENIERILFKAHPVTIPRRAAAG
jgi:hypothetical protein